jgi:DNA-directed RNA polymerase specialized sigma24 family protein
MTGDPGEAEDLVQETFVRIAHRWHRVAALDHPVAYARRVLINLALDGAGHRSRQRVELQPRGSFPDYQQAGLASTMMAPSPARSLTRQF